MESVLCIESLNQVCISVVRVLEPHNRAIVCIWGSGDVHEILRVNMCVIIFEGNTSLRNFPFLGLSPYLAMLINPIGKLIGSLEWLCKVFDGMPITTISAHKIFKIYIYCENRTKVGF